MSLLWGSSKTLWQYRWKPYIIIMICSRNKRKSLKMLQHYVEKTVVKSMKETNRFVAGHNRSYFFSRVLLNSGRSNWMRCKCDTNNSAVYLNRLEQQDIQFVFNSYRWPSVVYFMVENSDYTICHCQMRCILSFCGPNHCHNQLLDLCYFIAQISSHFQPFHQTSRSGRSVDLSTISRIVISMCATVVF